MSIFSLNEKTKTSLSKPILSIIGLWLMLLAISFFIPNGALIVSELSADLEFLISGIILFTLFKIYKDQKNCLQDNQKFVVWMFATNIWLFLVNFCFYFAAYVDDKYLMSLSFLHFLLYYAPCIVYSIIMITFLTKILLKNVLSFKKFFRKVIIFLLADLVIIFLFSSSIHFAVNSFSWENIAQIAMLTVELVLFDVAIISLMYANNSSIFLMLSGIIILITGDFFLTYTEISQTTPLFSYGELLWFLGMLFGMFSVFSIKKHKNYVIKDWFIDHDTLRSTLAFWGFTTSICSFLLFFLFAYIFSILNKEVFVGLPLFVMLYSIVVVILSLLMSRSFEEPIQKIQKNIDLLMNNEQTEEIDNNFSIKEYISLQKFISNSINLRKEKEKAKKDLYKIAEQVAHDIRSPVAAILMLARECVEIPETQRVTLRNAANRIQDIANVILHRYGNKKNASEYDTQPILVSAAILSLVSEKRAEYKDKKIEFSCEPGDSIFSFILANHVGFKRIMSNLVNNAVEAIQHKNGKIIISIHNNLDQVVISIVDNGSGMSKNKIQQITLSEEGITDKLDGHGIGWSQTKTFLKIYDATFSIESIMGAGTKIDLIFKLTPMPVWFTGEVKIKDDSEIIVLDDDESIHGAWNALFSDMLNSNHNITLRHFTDSKECIEYINQSSHAEKITLLADYELINQDMNGLDVITQIKNHQSVLVTSHYEDNDIIKRAILLNTKILPKLLAPNVKITLNSDMVFNNSQENADLVLLEDSKEVSSVVTFLYTRKNKHIIVHHTVYELLDNIHKISLDTKICLDYNLNCPVNGIDVAKLLHLKGYRNIYLASGFDFKSNDVPEYVKILDKKMSLINL